MLPVCLTAFASPLLIMAGLGVASGVLLTVAAHIFHIDVDPKVTEVREALPGANCGVCGFAGCDAYAEAVAGGRADVDRCIPGGVGAANALAQIMGVDAGDAGPAMVARVRCQGDVGLAREKYIYTGIDDCFAAVQIFDGHKACAAGCLGHGTCVEACPFGAISIVNQIAVIDEEACKACGRCIKACPKQLIVMVERRQRVMVLCNSDDRGNVVRANCDTGCIGCTRCVRACEHGAISMQGALAVIDYDKCVNCKACVEVCPTHAIRDFDAPPVNREKAAAKAGAAKAKAGA
ncbi:MAG: RnfABCDGE type electron transport complex subunit B [Bacillota bacterium]|nr:RnfABCDGE type electron transport complex subunit B [Bacillota bacterium]